jgi:uncharacterized membrane protein YdjX (TVP38/TMEM64 family)
MSQNTRPPLATLLYTVALGLLPLVGSSLVSWWVLENQEWIGRFGFAEWMCFFAVTAFTMAFALTPTTFVALLSGFLLGWLALLPLCVSYLAAALIGYRAVGYLDRGNLLQFLSQRKGVEAFMQKLQNSSLSVIAMSRLSPVLPFAVMNVVFSLVKIPVRPFLWGSFWGMLPRTVLSVWAGTQALRLQTLVENPDESLPWRVGLIVLTLVSVGGLGYLLRQMTRPTE